MVGGGGAVNTDGSLLVVRSRSAGSARKAITSDGERGCAAYVPSCVSAACCMTP